LKVSIVKGGGIAGVVTRTELATDALSPDDAAELRDIAVRDFFGRWVWVLTK